MHKFVWVSAHDFTSAQICAEASVDAVLIGDSLGMTVYGFDSTHHVTMEMMLAHAAAVKRAIPGDSPRIIVDMPFATYDDSAAALANADRFRALGIKHLKLEGGRSILPQVEALLKEGFRITGHLGMLPQHTTKFSVAARSASEQERLLMDARMLENAGIDFLVLECVPADFAAQVAEALTIPVIGIGAGKQVDGQVLVYADLIGRTDPAFAPRFLRHFGAARESEEHAVAEFCRAVRSGEYPDMTESY